MLLFVTGGVIGSTAGFNPISSGITLSVAYPVAVTSMKTLYMTFVPNMTFAPLNGVFVGINKEIWIDILMERFYPDGSWVTRARDMSAFVENDVINLADCGVDPTVLVNNTGLVGISQRADSPLALTLDTLDTENTVVKNVEAMEASYDKMASVISQHQKAIQAKHNERVIYNWAPVSTAANANTPVLVATGVANAVTGLNAITLKDVVRLQKTFNEFELPAEDRCLVLCPQHLEDLLNASETLQNQYVNLPEGKMLRYAGFDIYTYTRMPVYTKVAAPIKTAFGTTYVSANHTKLVSIAFVGSEVMNADGSVDMFYHQDHVEYRGDVVGFQKRSLGLSIRGKGVAALVSTT